MAPRDLYPDERCLTCRIFRGDAEGLCSQCRRVYDALDEEERPDLEVIARTVNGGNWELLGIEG